MITLYLFVQNNDGISFRQVHESVGVGASTKNAKAVSGTTLRKTQCACCIKGYVINVCLVALMLEWSK